MSGCSNSKRDTPCVGMASSSVAVQELQSSANDPFPSWRETCGLAYGPLTEMPPHLRIVWLQVIRTNAALVLPSFRLGVETNDERQFPYLFRIGSPLTVVSVIQCDRGGAVLGGLPTMLSEVVTAESSSGLTDGLVGLVMSLACWDMEFQRRRLFSGNVYLSSDQAACALLNISGEKLEAGVRVDELLSALHALELIYRFPVPMRFRGGFGPERQSRLNCWGRLLADNLSAQEHLDPRFVRIRARINWHLDRYGPKYLKHIESLHGLSILASGQAWKTAQELPVGVLV